MAALAPHVLNAAREGEGVARQAVDDAARELVELTEALARYFPGTGPVSVAIAEVCCCRSRRSPPRSRAARRRAQAGAPRPDKIDSAVGR